jgi:hypothetical protein
MPRTKLLGTLVVMLLAATALGRERFEQLLSPQIGEQQIITEFKSFTYFNVDVADQDDKLHMTRYDFNFSIPVWQHDQGELSLIGRVEAYDLDTDAEIPHTFDELPNTLWDVRAGATYRHRLNNGWTAGGTLEFGSASDRPFGSIDEMLLTVNAFLRIPHGERNAFYVLVNFDTNRQFLAGVPIPGVAYQWRPSDQFMAFVGVPFSLIRWEPIDRLELEATYFIPRIVKAKVGYRIVDNVKLYAGFDWTNERFMRADRDDNDFRLWYYEKRVAGGVRWDIIDNLWLDFSAGWAFDRFFFEAEEYDDRNDRRLDVDDSPMLMLQLGFRV